jgi:predicted membrane chloride channel (bestrophin family)
MIVYEKDAFGINLLFRVHGSAVYRAIIPALCSVGFFVIIQFLWDERAKSEILHPYACGLLIGGITFLIIFRLTQSYGRYWEAASAVFRMQSKFMDGTVHVSNFHMQSAQYDKIKPSRFIDHPELDAEFLTRDRERLRPSHQNSGLNGKISSQRAVAKSINAIGNLRMKKRQNLSKKNNNNEQSDRSIGSCVSANGERSENFQMILTTCFQSAEPQQGSGVEMAKDDTGVCNHENPRFLTGDPKMDGGWGILFNDDKSTYRDPRDPSKVGFKGFASLLGGRTPPLFLQELAHLASLLNAVALSTLRNDIEGVESPLGLYEPGSQWPPVDPGQIADFHDTKLEGVWQALLYFMGKGRSPEDRTKYNASRPLPVLGGVSDAEIHMLQMARGPLAKTQLCWSWLSEFMNRASIEGSLGPCGQALISRTNQFLSDGMMAYSDARKVMFIPFPFPHSQHSSLFVNIMIFIIPLMMDQYTGDAWLGCMLTFLSVMCLSGIHEVARELGEPRKCRCINVVSML